MLSDRVKQFAEARRQISSKDIVDKAVNRMDLLKEQWASTNSEDKEKREEIYREFRGIIHILDELVRNWS